MRRRTAPTPMTIAVAVMAAALCACTTGAAAGDAPVAPPPFTSPDTSSVTPSVVTDTSTAGSAVPLPDPVAAVPVAASSELPPTDAVTGLHRIHRIINTCLSAPVTCDVDSVAVPGSPAHRYLEGLVEYYVTHRLVLRLVPEVAFVVPESVHMAGPDRAEVTVCEADGSWQMDSRGTPSTADDIVWDDFLLSRRVRHTLVRSNGVWRRFEVVELQLWLGEQRCPATTSA